MLKMFTIFVVWAISLSLVLIGLGATNVKVNDSATSKNEPSVGSIKSPGLAEQAATKDLEHKKSIDSFENLTKEAK